MCVILCVSMYVYLVYLVFLAVLKYCPLLFCLLIVHLQTNFLANMYLDSSCSDRDCDCKR